MTDGERLALVHVGDSRAYRLRDGQLQQISRDHTFVQSLVDEGRITSAEARVHPHRSVLIRALDGRQEIEPDLSIIDAVPGDRLMICSDGVTDYLTDDRIRDLLDVETIDIATVDLVRAALEAGSADNVSCVVADVVDEEDLAREDPMIIGAAAEDVRPASVSRGPLSSRAVPVGESEDGAGSAGGAAAASQDPEELRYAPQPPKRFLWLRRLLLLLAVLGVLAVAAMLALDWTQRQYYVGVSEDGHVAIYRGIEQSVLGYELSEVDETSDLTVDALPEFLRERVLEGISASDREDAEQKVSDLQADADECSGESPDPETCEGADPTAEPTEPTDSETTPRPTKEPTDEPAREPTGEPAPTNGDQNQDGTP
jgi:protein phosphatase